MVETKKKSKPATTKPAPATPPVAVLETDLLPQETIRSEVNFLTLPFFSQSRHDKRLRTEYHATVKRGTEELEVYWKVAAHQDYGYPGVFDCKVHKAIEYIISQMKPPIQNPVPIGSLYRIAQLLGLGDSGRVYDDIKAATQRIVATTIESKGTYYDKGKRRWREATFHLYVKVVFAGEELDNGEVADDNYLYFDNWYLDNINARYVKPLDYTYYQSLKSPIACRLYELLGVKFYSGNPHIRYRYSNLCQLLPVTQYKYLSKAKEKLEPAYQELIATKFLAKVQWDDIPGEKHDWYVSYYPGARAKEEIQRFRTQAALPPSEDSVQATPQPAPATPPVADDVVNALQKFGITKKQAQKLAKDYPEENILAQLDYVKYLAENQAPQVSKNPQGYLVQAIQDGYPIPPQYKSKVQQAREAEEIQQREERKQQERVAARQQEREQLQQEHPPQPIAGTEYTTATAWAKALEVLQEQLPKPAFLTWLKDTLLVGMEGNTAQVLVANSHASMVIKQRYDGLIAGTLEQVLGYPVGVEFVVASSEDAVTS